MGFKFKRVNFQAGTAEFPVGDSNRRLRSETILKKVVQAIIDCNCGWVIDEDKCADIDAIKEAPTRSSGVTQPCLFLKNTSSSSDAKLFIGYYGDSTNNGISNSFRLFRPCSTGYDIFMTGLCMSMIPSGSESVFGDLSNPSTFMPDDATPIMSTRVHNNSGGWQGCSFAYNPTNSRMFSYGLFVSPKTIAVSAGYSDSSWPNLSTPGFMIGEIIGTLAHADDIVNNSKYGVLNFRVSDRGDLDSPYECSTSIIRYYIKCDNNTEQYFVGFNPFSTSFYIGSDCVAGAVAKADGSWVDGTNGSSGYGSTGTYCVKMYASDPIQLSYATFNPVDTNKSRWCPIAIRVCSSDLNTCGIVQGDGFKGYVDTSLLRCSVGTYGALYDNGNFICIDSTNHLLIGWDPSNTDSIAG